MFKINLLNINKFKNYFNASKIIKIYLNKYSSAVIDNLTTEELNSVRPYGEIPGPKPIPLLGNTWRFIPYIGNKNIYLPQLSTPSIH